MTNSAAAAETSVEVATVFQLGYASAASKPFTGDELTELLSKARRKNSVLGVTGILLYHEGSFIQILEGDQGTVETLYSTIAADSRHVDAMLLFRVESTDRAFDQWTMGFHHLTNGPTDTPPAGLSRFLETGASGITSEDGDKIRDVLLGFREGRWRRTVDY